MLLSHFNRELDKTAIIFEFLGTKAFRNLEKLFLDRTFPLTNKSGMNSQKFVYYGFHSRIFQWFPASRMCLNCVNKKEA